MSKKVGLVGLGCMGSAHLSNYEKLEANGEPVKLVAICDVDEQKFNTAPTQGNLDIVGDSQDLGKYKLYADMEEMIAKEELDAVDLCLPSYLHGPMSIRAMELGIHVFCEKPMSLTGDMCRQMIEASKKADKVLMIGQTLRYWGAYEVAKEAIENNAYGKCISGYFFRGGGTPIWSWENWLLQKDKSGGCLMDQHIHDVDAINWLFGKPDKVSSVARNVVPGSGYDVVSTNYIYDDGMVINAQDDWTMNGEGFPFTMTYRLNFEKGVIVYDRDVTIYPVGGKSFKPSLPEIDGYYKELRIFIELLHDNKKHDYLSWLESHKISVEMGVAEMKSADMKGVPIEIA